LKEEILRKSLGVSLDLLAKRDWFDSIGRSEIAIEHDLVPANQIDLSLDEFSWNSWLDVLGHWECWLRATLCFCDAVACWTWSEL
jgi:hypothetical protein